jgi:hypothetical protein
MKIILAFAVGSIAGVIAAQQLMPAHAQNAESDYQMFVTSGSSGGSYAYLLNTRTGIVRFCNGRSCFPVPMTPTAN